MYIIHTVMDLTEAMISQNLYWPRIIEAVMKEFFIFDTCQHKKISSKSYVKLPAKVAEDIPCTKLCVDIIVTYIVIRKVKKEILNLKAVTMVDPITGWLRIVEYNNSCAIKS